MKLMMAVAVFLAMAQASPQRPFPNHEQPPEGWFCVPAMNEKDVETNAHACQCRGMNLDDPTPHCKVPSVDEEGNPIMVDRGESSVCKVYCHKTHCHCSQRCKDS